MNDGDEVRKAPQCANPTGHGSPKHHISRRDALRHSVSFGVLAITGEWLAENAEASAPQQSASPSSARTDQLPDYCDCIPICVAQCLTQCDNGCTQLCGICHCDAYYDPATESALSVQAPQAETTVDVRYDDLVIARRAAFDDTYDDGHPAIETAGALPQPDAGTRTRWIAHAGRAFASRQARK